MTFGPVPLFSICYVPLLVGGRAHLVGGTEQSSINMTEKTLIVSDMAEEEELEWRWVANLAQQCK